jgi:uncharacterized membrane protein
MEGLAALKVDESVLHDHFGGLVTVLDWAAALIVLASILVMLIGVVRFALGFVRAEVTRDSAERARVINMERVELGRYILAGLELLIVSDVLRTALSFALEDVVFLGALVLVRSVISFFLSREIEGLERRPAAET